MGIVFRLSNLSKMMPAMDIMTMRISSWFHLNIYTVYHIVVIYGDFYKIDRILCCRINFFVPRYSESYSYFFETLINYLKNHFNLVFHFLFENSKIINSITFCVFVYRSLKYRKNPIATIRTIASRRKIIVKTKLKTSKTSSKNFKINKVYIYIYIRSITIK